jgi:hypothetical protein
MNTVSADKHRIEDASGTDVRMSSQVFPPFVVFAIDEENSLVAYPTESLANAIERKPGTALLI